MHSANITSPELVSYRYVTDETLSWWKQSAKKRDLKGSKLIKYRKNGHKITKISMHVAQTCINFFIHT